MFDLLLTAAGNLCVLELNWLGGGGLVSYLWFKIFCAGSVITLFVNTYFIAKT